ncbi:hypothetical protein GCM10029978_076880 [Actinoallomurus acanthiterrae]
MVRDRALSIRSQPSSHGRSKIVSMANGRGALAAPERQGDLGRVVRERVGVVGFGVEFVDLHTAAGMHL